MFALYVCCCSVRDTHNIFSALLSVIVQESLHVLPSYIHEVLGPIEPPGGGCCDQHSLPKLWAMVPGPWHANGMAIELGEWVALVLWPTLTLLARAR